MQHIEQCRSYLKQRIEQLEQEVEELESIYDQATKQLSLAKSSKDINKIPPLAAPDFDQLLSDNIHKAADKVYIIFLQCGYARRLLKELQNIQSFLEAK